MNQYVIKSVRGTAVIVVVVVVVDDTVVVMKISDRINSSSLHRYSS